MSPKTSEAIPRAIVTPAAALKSVNFQGWTIPVPPAPAGPGQFVTSPVDGLSQTVTSWLSVDLTDRRWPGKRDLNGCLVNFMDKLMAVKAAAGYNPRQTLQPNQTLPSPTATTAIWSQQYSVRFQWVALLQQVTQAGAMSHDITYTTGTDVTDSHTASFEASVGVEVGADYSGVSAKVTATFTYGESNTHEVTISKSETVTQHLEVPKNTTIQVWQLVQTFETGPAIAAFDTSRPTLAPAASLTQNTLEVISLSYPR